MLRSRLTTRPVAKTALRTRRPPDQYIDLLSRSESEFLEFVEQLERHPLFADLVARGVISRVRFRGRLPRAKYEEFMDKDFVGFLDRYHISDQPDWDKDFLARNALDRADVLAKKYSVPVGILVRYLRYLRSTSYDDVRSSLAGADVTTRDGSAVMVDASAGSGSDVTEHIGDTPRVDISDVIAIAQKFVETYKLTEQEFLDNVLSGAMGPEEIAGTYKCSLREAEDLVAATAQISFVETFESSSASPRTSFSGKSSSADGQGVPVAFARVKEDGSLALEFDGDSVYVQRYRIHMQALSHQADLGRDSTVRSLVDQARFINQRLSALSRVIMAICARQRPFLVSGDPKDLRPLSQADIARDLGEHQSTVSRLIRKKLLRTPHGTFPLTFLCQSKTDVVIRLVQTYPDKPDIQIRDILLNEYQCRIARRTVAYHRAKRLRRKPPAGHKSGSERA